MQSVKFWASLLFVLPLWGAYTSKATVSFSAATGSTQTNITLAFTGSDAKLKTVGNGGQIQNTVTRVGVTVPADFILTNDATCATVTGSWNWGIESYSATGGTIIGWAKVASLTTGSPVVPTVCIGNAAVSAYQGGAQGAEFDTNTKAAYRFPDGSTLSAKDFGPNSLDGTINSAMAHSGQVGGGMATSGTSQDVSVPNNALLNVQTGDMTIESWFFMVTNPGTTAVWDKGNLGRDYSFFVISPTSIYTEVGNSGGTTAVTGFTTGVWHHLVFSRTAGTGGIYLDGVFNASFGGGTANNGSDLSIGRGTSGGSDFNGYHDEFRVISTGRTANWIATEYANQLSPPAIGAFTSIGGTSTRASQGFTF